MSELLLDIKGERLSFFTSVGEVKALNDVSLQLREGEVLGIVGESGSGKSVTAYSIMGLTSYPGRLIGGSIWFNGHQIELDPDDIITKNGAVFKNEPNGGVVTQVMGEIYADRKKYKKMMMDRNFELDQLKRELKELEDSLI